MENIESVELFYVDKDEKEIPFTCFICKPSMKARTKILDLAEKHTLSLEKIESTYPELKEYEKASVYELPPNLWVVHQRKKMDLIKTGYQYTIKYFQAILTTKQLTSIQQEFIKEEPESDFWQLQNISKIEEAVLFFRGTNQV